LPDFLQTRKNGGFLRKITVLFELWGGSNQLWPKRVEMSAIPCGAWVSGISQSGLKNPAPDVNLPKSYNTRNQFACVHRSAKSARPAKLSSGSA